MASLTVRNAAAVVSFDHAPVRSPAEPAVLEHASVVCDNGVIAGVGDDADAEVVLDASGCTVVPGFVDCHSHLPFYGWRADEDAARLSGRRYETLHRGEGGIFRSARMLADASDADAIGFSSELAGAMLRRGTTTLETKSGYGLSVEAELRQLRLAVAVAERTPQRVVTTCLAAHAVPPGKTQGEWVGEAADALLPAAAREGLASACDVYVESIAFALEHAARLAESAGALGLRMRIHADQLEDGQAGAFAARWGFATADHLNHTSSEAAADIAATGTAAVLLPGATFTLRQAKKPPARTLLEAGAVVALGTDFNPGTSPIHSMPLAMALACRLYGLRPHEALAAGTVNAAYALGLHEERGRIAGEQAVEAARECHRERHRM
ncbi:MAG TPA: imidazolonepropionase, partial [Actinomycetota bacterium]|nr:imidazolonepropionase [Actinomycetota bacterium]